MVTLLCVAGGSHEDQQSLSAVPGFGAQSSAQRCHDRGTRGGDRETVERRRRRSGQCGRDQGQTLLQALEGLFLLPILVFLVLFLLLL